MAVSAPVAPHPADTEGEPFLSAGPVVLFEAVAWYQQRRGVQAGGRGPQVWAAPGFGAASGGSRQGPRVSAQFSRGTGANS